MPSPFPGMNPYLEQPDAWHSFHDGLIHRMMSHLVRQVRPEYIVKTDEHVYIHQHEDADRTLVGRGDVTVAEFQRQRTSGGVAVATMAAPVYGEILPVEDTERENYLEIRDRRTRELITVIELLSPANKQPGKDREAFIHKRALLLETSAHHVEIDLLRAGSRLPVEGLPECDYYALVSRREERPAVGLWPLSLRDPLPTIPIPLRDPTPDASLDLQAVLQQAFEDGGYADYIYEGEPVLGDEQRQWAQALLETVSRDS